MIAAEMKPLRTLLVVGTMRAGSWVMGWILTSMTRMTPRRAALVSNAAGFGLFLLLLDGNLIPGEPLDWAAVLFGLAVFAVCATIDLFWRPWKSRVWQLFDKCDKCRGACQTRQFYLELRCEDTSLHRASLSVRLRLIAAFLASFPIQIA